MFHVEPSNLSKMFHVEQSSQNKVCPICGGAEFSPYISLTDHFLSHEEFHLLKCDSCDVLITTPAPSPDNVFNYYKSDDYVSHNDSKKGVINFAYQQVKNITLRQKISLIKKHTSRKRLLDFGCGTGDFLRFASTAGFEVCGIEPDSSARKISQSKGINVYDISYLDDSTNSFDAITLWHVLEHTYDPLETLSQLKNILRPGGVIILALPNYLSADAQQFKSHWAAYDVPRHLFHFCQKTIQVLSDKLELKLIETKPMPFDAFYVSMLSKKYQTGKMPAGVLSGLKSNQKAQKTGEYSSLIYVLQKEAI